MIVWCWPCPILYCEDDKAYKETRIVALPFEIFIFFLTCLFFIFNTLSGISGAHLLRSPLVWWDRSYPSWISRVHIYDHESSNPMIMGLCFIGMTFYFCYWCFVKLPGKVKVSQRGNHRELLCAPIVLSGMADPWKGGLLLSLVATGKKILRRVSPHVKYFHSITFTSKTVLLYQHFTHSSLSHKRMKRYIQTPPSDTHTQFYFIFTMRSKFTLL